MLYESSHLVQPFNLPSTNVTLARILDLVVYSKATIERVTYGNYNPQGLYRAHFEFNISSKKSAAHVSMIRVKNPSILAERKQDVIHRVHRMHQGDAGGVITIGATISA